MTLCAEWLLSASDSAVDSKTAEYRNDIAHTVLAMCQTW